MVTPTPVYCQTLRPAPWQQEVARGVRSAAELCQLLELDPALATAAQPGAQQFAVRVPRHFIARMERGNPTDPLLLQVLPRAMELIQPLGYSADPVGDHRARCEPAVLRKYAGRLLLLTTPACAIHCRYCLRRCFPFSAGIATPAALTRVQQLLHTAPDVNEVILSGGDPLLLGDAVLARVIQSISQLPQVQRLRIHTRMPVIIPQRVTGSLLQLFQQQRLPIVVVIHANHAAELTDDVAAALGQLRAAGITLLNQSVLLRGVNDQVATLQQLSERLFACGVLPYYVHLLDHVIGSAAFAVPDAVAQHLFTQLRQVLPGYLMPRPVREMAGALYKLPFG